MTEQRDNVGSDARNESNGLSTGLIVLILIGVALLVATRFGRSRDEARQIPFPPLEVAGWLNTDAPPTGESLEGRVVLIDCWATWCGPCVEKMPQVVRFYERFHDRGVVVIGLTTESGGEVENLRSYVESVRGLDWPIGYGAVLPFQIMGIEAIPTFVLFDRSGRSVWHGHNLAGLEEATIAALAEESQEPKVVKSRGSSVKSQKSF